MGGILGYGNQRFFNAMCKIKINKRTGDRHKETPNRGKSFEVSESQLLSSRDKWNQSHWEISEIKGFTDGCCTDNKKSPADNKTGFC